MNSLAAQPPDAWLDIDVLAGETRLRFGGSLVIGGLTRWIELIGSVEERERMVLDLSDLAAMDTAGAWFLLDQKERLEAKGVDVTVEAAGAGQRELLGVVEASLKLEKPPPPPPLGWIHWLECIGESTAASWKIAAELISLLGQTMVLLFGVLLRPWRLRWTALVSHMETAGLQAAPIVALMAFLIGVVMAFQGAVQLEAFGAEIFVVDLLAISILRELGVLLTAILVAGRSGSAFTAAIGSMKMREEIDAMRTLGLEPISVLVLPRVLALLITLPILAFLANIVGLVGGALMCWINLGISPGLFIARLWEGTDVGNFIVGMSKAPFFAVTIALVGCFEGLKVEGNAESLGARTSRAVVESIFLVIVLDALFSVFFALIGV
ncbi:MAG: ABC transporter permease [Pseudomonadota bacterium]